MSDFEDLVEGISAVRKETEAYLNDFFVKKNLKEYEIPQNASKESVKAIRMMFESKKELKERARSAFEEDPFCLEAFFTYFILSEDIYVSYRFEAYRKEASEYADFDDYTKHCYLRIMDFYVDFLLDLHNITLAITIQRLIARLSGGMSPRTVSRLALMYSIIEDEKEFYRLYLDNEFDCYDYLLLLVTLLKHEEEIKAKEILFDMFDRIEYASYIDHLWDLDLNDPKQESFYKTVEDCYEEISSIPCFFSWVNELKEANENKIVL